MKTLLTIAVAIWCTAALAQESTAVLGNGTISCGKWLQDNQGWPAIANKAWVLGYLTGANAYNSINDRDISAGKDTAALTAWIDNYCRANPLEDLRSAAHHLILTLVRAKH